MKGAYLNAGAVAVRLFFDAWVEGRGFRVGARNDGVRDGTRTGMTGPVGAAGGKMAGI
jgi:hypothetical protein